MTMAPKTRQPNGKKKHEQDLLDESLDESFPASDPSSLTQGSAEQRAYLDKKGGRKQERSDKRREDQR